MKIARLGIGMAGLVVIAGLMATPALAEEKKKAKNTKRRYSAVVKRKSVSLSVSLLLAFTVLLIGCQNNRSQRNDLGKTDIGLTGTTKSGANKWAEIDALTRSRILMTLLERELISHKLFEGVAPTSCGAYLTSTYHVIDAKNQYTGNPIACSSTPSLGDIDYELIPGQAMVLKNYVEAPGGGITTETWHSWTDANPQGHLIYNSRDFYIFIFKIYDVLYTKFTDTYWRRPNSLSELLNETMFPQAHITDPRTGNLIILSDDITPAPYKFYIHVATGRFIAYDQNSNPEPQTESETEVFGMLGKSSQFLYPPSSGSGLQLGMKKK